MENLQYPKKFPCTICGQNTLREEGDNYYKYSYRCVNKKCHRNKSLLYGKCFEFDGEKDEEGNMIERGTDASTKEKKYYIITYKNGNFSIEFFKQNERKLFN